MRKWALRSWICSGCWPPEGTISHSYWAGHLALLCRLSSDQQIGREIYIPLGWLLQHAMWVKQYMCSKCVEKRVCAVLQPLCGPAEVMVDWAGPPHRPFNPFYPPKLEPRWSHIRKERSGRTLILHLSFHLGLKTVLCICFPVHYVLWCLLGDHKLINTKSSATGGLR